MIKKISYVLDRRQKINIALLLVIIFIGAFVELLGVSMILPIINIALSPEVLDEKWYYIWIKKNLGITEVNDMIILLSGVLIGIYILKNIYVTLMYNEQYRFTNSNQRKLAVKLMDCYMRQKYPFHVSKNVAELQRNVTSDVNGFYTVVLNALQFLAEMSVCIVLVLFLMFEDWMSTLIVAILVAIFVLFFGLFFKKVLGRKGEESRRLNAELTKWILQAFSGIKEIKVVNAENFFIDNYEKTYRQSATIRRHQLMLTFIPRPLMETVCISGLLITMIIKLSFGQGNIVDFIPTLSVFAIAAFRMLPSFNRITAYLSNIMFNKASIDAVHADLVEIEDLLKKYEKEEQDSTIVKLDEKISIENVSFKYPESDKWILDNANLSIKKNTSIALIGTSGAGKTTVADLLLGLFEPQKGKITVDGVDIETHLQSWHKSLGYIPQTIYLMDDTIRANIAFGISKNEINDETMQKALKEAQLDTFVNGLKDGLDTVIGEQGVKLSGGQRQRIGIARALYRNPEVLILDEATSALDNDTEKEVMEAIDGLHGTRTLIVIAHRLSTIKKCDYIYEVGNGKILEKDKLQVISDI